MTRRRAWTVALIALAVAFASAHVFALYTDGANWDEFAQLRRAYDTLQSGSIQGGGRPGLVVLPLLPFVDDCTHVMSVVVSSRVLWSVFTFAMLAGLFALLRRATRRSPLTWHAAALGTASLALVPIFLRWSLQVRTDQPAIAAALWAGVALLAMRTRWWFAGGFLLGIGYLCSQKAIYVTALVAVIAAGDIYVEAAFDWRRELRRLASAALGAALVILAFRVVVSVFFESPHVTSVGQGLDLFRWYRHILKFRLYRDILPTVYPQVGLLLLIFAAAIRAFRCDTPERRPLLVALVIVVLGIAVGRFHTASFPYFWMTIGLFPACAIAYGLAGIRELLPRAYPAIVAVAWGGMLVYAVHYRIETVEDTQKVQRDTFALVEGLPGELRGFNTDGGLICRRDPDPLPYFFGQHIGERFGGAHGAEYTEQFIREHRTRPISFLVLTNRVTFPPAVNTFWATHYVPYRDSVWLPGQRITGPVGTRANLDIIMRGTYRWITQSDAHVVVDNADLAPQQTIELEAGAHIANLAGTADGGMLVLAVETPPGPPGIPFYDSLPLAELSGVRGGWW